MLPFISNAQTTTTCFEIQSILVDACGSNEGNNEMVRFLVGPNNLNTSNLTAVWANTSNAWLGVCQNATTAGYVSQINNTIVSCGLIIEPINGILPANKKIILVSGSNFDPSVVSFANLADTLYMIFHCGTGTSGNFANVGTGIRNFSMSFGAGCSDQVSYDRSLLTGGNGATVEYSFAGTATYTNYGCSAPVTSFSAAWTQPQPLCEGDLPLNLNLLITGTAGGTWSGQGVTGSTFSPLGLSGNIAVNYTVGSGNCVVEEEKFIVINQGGTATWTIPPSVCAGNSITNLNTFVTGTAGGTWSGVGVLGSSFNSTGLLGNISITYAVGSGTCATQVTQNINVIAAPNASWNFTNPIICESENSINLNTLVTGTLGGTWSGTGVNGSTFSPTDLSGIINITYAVGIGTCSDTQVNSINVILSPNAAWTPPSSLCANENPLNLGALITGTPNGVWSGPGVTGDFFSPNGLSGSITLIYSVGVGVCAQSLGGEIQVVPALDASWNFTANTVCSSNAPLNLNLLILGDEGGVWNGTGVSGAFFSPSGLNGLINITYSVGLGTCQVSESNAITVLNVPNSNWNLPPAFCNNDEDINLNSLVTGAPGGTWTGPGVVESIFSPLGLSGNISIGYSVGTGICTAFNGQSTTVNPAPAAPSITGVDTYCIGDLPQNLTVSGAGNAQFTWYTDVNLTTQFGVGASISPAANQNTTYYVVQSLNSCTSNSSFISVTFNSLPTTPIVPSIVEYCAGVLPVLTASGSLGTYTWFADAGLTNILATGANFQTVDATITSYFVTAQNAGCTSVAANVQIQLGTQVSAVISPNGTLIICNNQPITLTSASSTGNVWSTLATTSSIEVSQSGEYTLTVTGACNTDVATVNVINGTVTADFTVSPLTGLAPLTSTITDESINGDQIIWSINGEVENVNSGEVRVFEVGEYVVQQLVISAQGCRDSVTQTIKSISNLVELLVPNSFTPNGDSKNDTFKAVSYGIAELQGTIFNRWGEQIFQWQGPNNGWDGRTNGRMSPDGVYFYLIIAKDTFKKDYEKYGSVTLLK